MTRSDAWDLFSEFNKDAFHIEHAKTVEGVMRYFAVQEGFGGEAEFWGNVGLLHDLDFEQYPREHCIKQQEIMRQRGVDEKIIHATCSHGWKLTVDIEPVHRLEKI
ncbi:MAG: hydrolase, partial [Planctomycetaceae bacterium]|nr:hydrolase [Planctomycetaceae bacterium]